MAGTRVQIAMYDTLVGDVICENYREADRTWAAYAALRYRSGKPMGCCCINSADIPRIWDVPVGSIIRSKSSESK